MGRGAGPTIARTGYSRDPEPGAHMMDYHYMLLRFEDGLRPHWERPPGEWEELQGPNPRWHPGALTEADVVVERDPQCGFTIHVLTRANIFELEELQLALQCCSRFQPVNEDERWMYE